MAKKAAEKQAKKRPLRTTRSRAKKRVANRTGPPAKNGTPKEASGKIAARPGHISVRMYNNILGDCFLVRIPAGQREVKILIDCGALQGMPGASDIIGEIAADIAHTTDYRLDVLAITHEHWDHLSGFCQAQGIFAKFTIDELWLAWTEDERDPDAARIRARRRKTLDLLLTLDSHFGSVTAPEEDPDAEIVPSTQRDDVRELLTFTGEAPLAATAGSAMTTDEILTGLKKLATNVRYFTPGAAPIALPANVPIQAYVLGPPKDDKLVLRSNPRKGEAYSMRGETDELGAYLAAAIQLDKQRATFDADEQRAFEMAMPFGGHHYRALSAVEPAPGDAEGSAYFAERNAWRRIDRDWLGAAEQLALKLNSDTNNTSLVLAFVAGEGADRRVLLFAGDAQVGNWESWQQYIWPSGVGCVTVS